MPVNEALCTACPLYGQFTPTEPQGPEDARFLVITGLPSAESARKGRLLPPSQLGAFAGHMEDVGFTKNDFRFFPACRCSYNPDDFRNKEKDVIHKHCRQHVLEELDYLKPDAVLALGGVAAVTAFGRKVKITKVRGLPTDSEELEAPIFPLTDPMLVVRYPQNEPIFRADVQAFARFVDSGYDAAASTSLDSGQYTIIDDLQFLIDEDPELIAFDLETTALRWYKRGVDVRTYTEARRDDPLFDPRFQILTMQFTIRSSESFMLVWDHPENPVPLNRKPILRRQLRKLLCDPKRIVVGQSLKFDNVGLWMTEGIRFRIGGCTLMQAALLDENQMEKNLDMLTKIHIPELAGYADKFNAQHDKSRMWQIPLNDLRSYGCGDSDAAYRLYEVQEEMIAQDEMLWQHYVNVSLPGLNALAAMETRGMHIDDERQLPQFQAFMEAEVVRQYNSLLHQVPREIKRDVLNTAKKSADPEKTLSFGRAVFLKEILFNHPKGFKLKPKVFTKGTAKLTNEKLREPSTSAKDHLPYFFDTHPFTYELAEYVKDERLLSTNVIGFHKKYVVGSKVRPVYSLSATVTGRTSSNDPNGQNYPKRSAKAAEYRKMFVAPSGKFICELDLSQAELRIAACMANDPTMIKIYKENGDIHRATALIVSGKSEEQFSALPKKDQKELRQKAKACIAAGQLVLTRDRGLVPIEKILISDLVWDGIHWVTHQGIEYQGFRNVMEYAGVIATPEHFVHTTMGVMPLYMARELSLSLITETKNNSLINFYYGMIEEVDYLRDILDETVTTESIRAKAKEYGYRQLILLRKYNSTRVARDGKASSQTLGSKFLLRPLQSIANNFVGKYLQGSNNQLCLPESHKISGRPESISVGGSLRCHKTKMPEHRYIDTEELRCARNRESISESGRVYPVHSSDSAAPGLQRVGHRPHRQQWALRAGQPSVGDTSAEFTKYPNQSTCDLQGRDGPSDVSSCFNKKAPSDNGLLYGNDQKLYMDGDDTGANYFTVERKEPPYFYSAKTYDPINAGVNHRFTLSDGQTVAQCNFGFLYGMGWKKFIGYAKTQYNAVFTEDEAQRVRAGFFKKYSRLDGWHKKMREFARNNKYVRSFSGRVRHLPMIDSPEEWVQNEAERQGINSPVQEFGSSLGVMALGRMNEELDPQYIEIVGFIHDAIVFYVDQKYLDWGMRTVKRYMQSNPIEEWFGVTLPVPIIADCGFGHNLGQIIECEHFDLDQPFAYDKLVDENNRPLITVPEQEIPLNNGRLTDSAYTDPDAPDIDVQAVRRVRRSIISA